MTTSLSNCNYHKYIIMYSFVKDIKYVIVINTKLTIVASINKTTEAYSDKYNGQ